MIRSLFLAAALLGGPAIAQEVPASGDAAPMAFPDDLILLPEAVQEQAAAGLDAETATLPTGMTAAEEAWYRAQLAFVAEDWFLARRYAETAAAAGNADAAALSGLMARDGRGGERDIAAAARWFRRGADQDHPVALYQLGQLARLGDDSLGLGDPRQWYERAARAGHIEGMVAYALALRNSPVPQDGISARRWAERAAQQNSAEGMYQLAQMLDEGIGGERDAEGARVWYERPPGPISPRRPSRPA